VRWQIGPKYEFKLAGNTELVMKYTLKLNDSRCFNNTPIDESALVRGAIMSPVPQILNLIKISYKNFESSRDVLVVLTKNGRYVENKDQLKSLTKSLSGDEEKE